MSAIDAVIRILFGKANGAEKTGAQAGPMATTSTGDARTRELLRMATTHKEKKQWGEAIDCLASAEELMDSSSEFFGAAVRVRLPQYIHLSGDFDQAWVEFNLLLDKLDVVNYLRFCRHGAAEAQVLRLREKALVLEKMGLAAKRAKRPDLVAGVEKNLEELQAPIAAAKSQFTLEFLTAKINKGRTVAKMFPRVRWLAVTDVRCDSRCAELHLKEWKIAEHEIDQVVRDHCLAMPNECRCTLQMLRIKD